jgi:TM2 domain-containing membrane protein YozV
MSSDLTGPETAAPQSPVTVPAPSTLPPYVRPPKSPGLALFLSLFPGLGQVYNGQPAKAFVFFFTWVGSIYGAATLSPFPFAFLIPFIYLYNLVDAFRSAVFINDRHAGGATESEETGAESPAWGASLVVFGLLLLANNLGWLDLLSFRRFWPLILIVAGGAFIYSSIQKGTGSERGHGGQL